MADQLIDQIINQAAIDKQLAGLLAGLKEAEDAIVRVNGLAKNQEVRLANVTGMADMRKEIAEAARIMEQFNGKSKELTVVALNLEKAQAQAARAAKEQAQADLAASKAAETRTRAIISQDKELDRQIDREQKAKTATDRKAAADSKAATAAEKKAAADRAATAQAERQAAVNAAAPDSLKRLSATLEDLRKGYYLLTKEERENEHIGGVLRARIQELDAQLKSADGSLGKFTRNVGNYPKGMGAVAASTNDAAGAQANFQHSIQQIARELPSLSNGIATFASAIGNNLAPAQEAYQNFINKNKELKAQGKPTVSAFSALRGAIFNFNTLMVVGATLITVYGAKLADLVTGETEAKKATDEFNKSLKEVDKTINESAGEEIAKLKQLEEAATSSANSIDQRREAAKKMQELYPSILGNLTQEAIMEGKAKDAIINTANAILMKARASAAARKLELMAGRELELMDKQRQAEIDFGNAKERAARAVNADADNDAQLFEQLGQANALPAYAQKYRDVRKELIELNGEQAKLIGYVQAYSDLSQGLYVHGLTGGGDKDKKAKAGPDLSGDAVKDEQATTKALYDNLRARAELEKEYARSITEDQEENFDFRLAAQSDYVRESVKIAGYNLAQELTNIQTQLDEIERIRAKSEDKRTAAENKRLNDEPRLLDERKAIRSKYELDILQIANTGADQRKKLIADEAEFTKKNLDEVTAYAIKKGKEYTKAQQDEASKTNLAGLGKSADTGIGTSREDYDKQQAIYGQTYSKAREAVGELKNLEQALYAQKFAALDEEARLMERNLAIALNAVDLQGGSEEERAKKKAVLQAEAFAQEEALMQKRRVLQRKQAIFEKSLTIAQIIIDTAAAIVKALKTGGPAGIALAVATGALGAAQIATAIATPIPSFEKGGIMPHDGPAQVAEKGAELGISPDGEVTLYNARHLAYLKKGTEIKTADETRRIMASLPAFGRYDDATGKMVFDVDRLITAGSMGHNKVAGRQDETNKLLRQVIKNTSKTGIDWNGYL